MQLRWVGKFLQWVFMLWEQFQKMGWRGVFGRVPVSVRDLEANVLQVAPGDVLKVVSLPDLFLKVEAVELLSQLLVGFEERAVRYPITAHAGRYLVEAQFDRNADDWNFFCFQELDGFPFEEKFSQFLIDPVFVLDDGIEFEKMYQLRWQLFPYTNPLVNPVPNYSIDVWWYHRTLDDVDQGSVPQTEYLQVCLKHGGHDDNVFTVLRGTQIARNEIQ